jgi:hypothetical protein
MFDGKAVGTIDSIEKNKANVNYGAFTQSKSRSIRICGSRKNRLKSLRGTKQSNQF